MSEIEEKGSMQKNSPLVQNKGSLTDSSDNSLISDEIVDSWGLAY